MKLNAGCGKQVLPDWINLDIVEGPGIDVVANLENPEMIRGHQAMCGLHDKKTLLLEDHFEELFLSHTFEHLRNPLVAMYNLWLLAKPDAKLTVRCPWGGSHIAFEDPTHVRSVFLQTMHYFGQTAYNAADYGYRGDWLCKKQILVVDPERINPNWDAEEIVEAAKTFWNVGVELISELYAVKPARAPGTPSPAYQLHVVTTEQLQPGP